MNLDDETRIEMCRDFHSKDDKKWEVLSGDQYKGAEKLKVCDRMEKVGATVVSVNYVHPPGGWIYYFCFFCRPASDVRRHAWFPLI